MDSIEYFDPTSSLEKTSVGTWSSATALKRSRPSQMVMWWTTCSSVDILANRRALVTLAATKHPCAQAAAETYLHMDGIPHIHPRNSWFGAHHEPQVPSVVSASLLTPYS